MHSNFSRRLRRGQAGLEGRWGIEECDPVVVGVPRQAEDFRVVVVLDSGVEAWHVLGGANGARLLCRPHNPFTQCDGYFLLCRLSAISTSEASIPMYSTSSACDDGSVSWAIAMAASAWLEAPW